MGCFGGGGGGGNKAGEDSVALQREQVQNNMIMM